MTIKIIGKPSISIRAIYMSAITRGVDISPEFQASLAAR